MSVILTGLNPCFNGRWSLRAQTVQRGGNNFTRLNPCFNGRWSLRNILAYIRTIHCCLNPCFNGRWSLRAEDHKTLLFSALSIGKRPKGGNFNLLIRLNDGAKFDILLQFSKFLVEKVALFKNY